MRYLSGAEPVEVRGYGIGVMVNRAFMPDCWEGEPLRLVLLEQTRDEKKAPIIVAAAFEAAQVTPTMEEPSQRLIDESWEFQR